MSERDMLIEQCMMDAYCERMGITPDQLDEGWWDSMKAGAAGAWAGAKQGLSNIGTGIKNVGRVVNNAKHNAGQGLKMAGSLLRGDREGLQKGLDGLTSVDDKLEAMMPTSFAKNFAKAQSFSKSASETLGQWVTAMQAAFGENFPGSEAITAIQQSMDQVVKNNAKSAWKLFGGGGKAKPAASAKQGAPAGNQNTAGQQGTAQPAPAKQPATPPRDHEGGNDQGDTHDAYMSDTENEESLQDSYDPTRNSRAQRLMLESIR